MVATVSQKSFTHKVWEPYEKYGTHMFHHESYGMTHTDLEKKIIPTRDDRTVGLDWSGPWSGFSVRIFFGPVRGPDFWSG